MSARIRKKYTFKPNRNTFLVLATLVFFIWLVTSVSSCARYHGLRGAKYTHEEVLLPEFQVRKCVSPNGTPTADFFEIYPPQDGDKVVYLTFDDGPTKKITPQILDILKRYNIKATFFVIANHAKQYPELVERAVREGHAIANHGCSQDYGKLYNSPEEFRTEINNARQVLKEIAGEKGFVDIFRFPGGAFRNERAEFKEVLISENVPYVNWNCTTGDTDTKDPVPADLITKAKKTAASANSDALTVLMHDAGAKQSTVDALPGLIDYFRSQGYRFDKFERN